MVTQENIARQLSLSKSTVSRILSGKTVFEDETRARVMALAAQLGYRHLRPTVRRNRPSSGKVTLLEVVIERDPDPVIPVVAMRVLRGISEAARMEEVAIHVDTFTRDEVRRLHLPQHQPALLKNGQISGLLLLGEMNVATIRGLSDNLPCVRVNNRESDLKLDCVGQNDLDATEALVEHLFGLGHKHIGFLTDWVGNWPYRTRLAGFWLARMRLGLAQRPEYVVIRRAPDKTETDGWDSAHREVLRQIEKGVRAWVCVHDDIGYRLMGFLRSHKLDVPRDVAVCGFDKLDPPSSELPRLTTIDWPFEDIGAAAMRLLLRRILEPAGSKAYTMFSGRLVVEASTVSDAR
jgi:LacI family transcriptional regulator